MSGAKPRVSLPGLKTPGLDHKKIILDDSAARIGEIRRFNRRLGYVLLGVVLASMLATSYFFYQTWTRENSALESRLATFTELREQTLERFLDSLTNEVRLWSEHPDIVEDAKHFIKDWHMFSPDEITDIRREFIDGVMPQTLSDVQRDYNVFHDDIHPTLSRFSTHHGYYDVFIFDLEGNLVYTVEKEDDFGLNFLAGGSEYAESGLGRAYRRALMEPNPTTVIYEGLSAYAPSNGDPAAFLSSKIINGGGKVIGVYAVQIPISRFNEVLENAQGLGETGESYLVDENFIMQNQSRLSTEPTMLTRKVDNGAVRAALSGQTVIQKARNNSGVATIVAAMPLSYGGVNYAVATEMELREKRAPLKPYITLYLVALAFLLLFGWVAYVILKARQAKRIHLYGKTGVS